MKIKRFQTVAQLRAYANYLLSVAEDCEDYLDMCDDESKLIEAFMLVNETCGKLGNRDLDVAHLRLIVSKLDEWVKKIDRCY